MHGRSTPCGRRWMTSSFISFSHLLTSVVLLLLLSLSSANDDVTRYEKCYLRCIARCVKVGTALAECEKTCAPYEKVDFCAPTDDACWQVCKDLGEQAVLSAPTALHTAFANGSRNVQWGDVERANLYAVQYRKTSGSFEEDKAILATSSNVDNLKLPSGGFCDPFFVRVAAVSENGVSPFTAEMEVEAPLPTVSPFLQLQSLIYSPEPYSSDFYQANGTLIITFEYDDLNWPLGPADLIVTPMFNSLPCEIPDYSVGIPVAEFYTTTTPRQLQARLGADQMYRRCRYYYYAQTAESKQCKTKKDHFMPVSGALKELYINCSTVENAPCSYAAQYPPPKCGQIDTFDVQVQTPVAEVLEGPVSVNLSFTPRIASNESPTLYYIALYGNAEELSRPDENLFYGLNQTDVIGNITNCHDGEMTCKNSVDLWFAIDDLHVDNLYGVTICAIKDLRNLTLPTFPQQDRARTVQSLRLFLDSKEYIPSKAPLIIGLSVSAALLVGIVVFCCCFFRWKRIQKENEHYQIKLREMELEKDRYIDFPKKNDIWEVDRRNVEVYTNKKLGSGAFGAVYLGRLLGQSLASHDSNSPLGVNLMRSENCEVAIKTLPESADDKSIEEFLREIALMKSIGYHERLVNMLACVTESDPHLLIVEFCSDGDLLRFLRDRCKYMMKLDELGINYGCPNPEDNVDLEMIVTMKQLLMFAVQISYGLEYLSQKGFVHRDVAARNVLVHEKNACKIGDFGLCRQIGKDEEYYKSKGGRLPLKWMSPEAIKEYEFSTKSDVWAFGVLLFEVITLGGCPFPEWPASEVLLRLENGERMPQPDNCPDTIYSLMKSCWQGNPVLRPDFSLIRQRLATLLEEVTEEYSYLKLDSQQNYYNVQYDDDGKVDVADMPMKLPRRDSYKIIQTPPPPTTDDTTGHHNPAFTLEVGSNA